MLLLALLIAHLLGFVGALVVCAKKGKKSTQPKTKETFSSTKSGNYSKNNEKTTDRTAGSQIVAVSGVSTRPAEKPKVEEKASESTHKKDEQPTEDPEYPTITDFKPVPPLTPTRAAKMRHALEREREQRVANGEFTKDVDDTLDAIESMRAEKTEDRTPAEHLKNIDWNTGHPDRARNQLRYEQKKRYDEWNSKPHFLHRRHMRHLSVVATMQAYQLALVQKEGNAAATKQMKAAHTQWRKELVQDHKSAKHARCPYSHGVGDVPSCGDEHITTLACVDLPPVVVLDPKDGVMVK